MSATVDLRVMGRERVRNMVTGHVSSIETGRVEAIVDRIMQTGECVWHACSAVCNTVCWCATCAPKNADGGPEESPELAKARAKVRARQEAEVRA